MKHSSEKIKRTQKRFWIQIGIIIAALACFFAAFLYTSNYKNTQAAEQERLQQQQQRLTQTLQRLEKEQHQAQKNFEYYQEIPQTRFPLEERLLETVASRIRASRSVVRNLQLRYYLMDMDVNLSAVQDITTKKQEKFFRVKQSHIDMEFGAVSDASIYSFLSEMIDILPGYIDVQSLEITKNSEISASILQDIRDQAPLTPLVNGSVRLLWTTTHNVEVSE